MSPKVVTLTQSAVSSMATVDFIVWCTIRDPDFNILPIGDGWVAQWGERQFFADDARSALEAVARSVGFRLCDHPGDVAALCAELAPALCLV